jgi:hypothetical protein
MYVALHRDNALTASAKLGTLSLFGILSAGESASSAAWANITEALAATNTATGVALATAIGLAVAAFGGPVGLIVGTAYAFLGAYWSVVEKAEEKLANDPPDSAYTQVFEYTTAPELGFALNLGETNDAYFTSGFVSMVPLLESLEGQLKSLERAQGALLAGDDAMAAMQFGLAEKFAADYYRFAPAAGEWFVSLEPFLRSNGADDIAGIDEIYELANATALGLGVTQVPEPGTLLLLSGGLLGFGLMRRRRSTA